MVIATPPGYAALDERGVPAFLSPLPGIAERLGGRPEDWRVAEVGDGNLNLVFLVDGPAGSVCVKQALPYVRLVGESWPLPLERAFFEKECMALHGPHVGRLAPALLHYDAALFAIVMERLAPHVIMRRGMIAGIGYPRFAADIASYMAGSLFFTSTLALPAAEARRQAAVFSANTALCGITEELIFTDPYRIHERNRWTSPQLDAAAAAIRDDVPLKRAISRLKLRFMTDAQALIHGDLHTGSVMVTQDDTRVIDPEFAVRGPMGFDVGAVIGNLLMSYFSQDGHAAPGDPRADYQDWILATVEEVWEGFAARFLRHWRAHGTGDAFPADLFAGPSGATALEDERRAFMRALFVDTLGFAAAKTIRRILGLAHNIDFEQIADPDMRARCERRALTLARTLMVEAEAFSGIADVTALARAVREEG